MLQRRDFPAKLAIFKNINFEGHLRRLLLNIKISTSCHVYIRRYMKQIMICLFVLIFFMKTIYNGVL